MSRPRGIKHTESLRRNAAKLYHRGVSAVDIAKQLQCSAMSVYLWAKKYPPATIVKAEHPAIQPSPTPQESNTVMSNHPDFPAVLYVHIGVSPVIQSFDAYATVEDAVDNDTVAVYQLVKVCRIRKVTTTELDEIG